MRKIAIVRRSIDVPASRRIARPDPTSVSGAAACPSICTVSEALPFVPRLAPWLDSDRSWPWQRRWGGRGNIMTDISLILRPVSLLTVSHNLLTSEHVLLRFGNGLKRVRKVRSRNQYHHSSSCQYFCGVSNWIGLDAKPITSRVACGIDSTQDRSRKWPDLPAVVVWHEIPGRKLKKEHCRQK